MIPEPFTYAVAGFGVLMTLVNTIGSTLETFKARKDKFLDAPDRLRELEDDLFLCNMKLAQCLEKWKDEDENELMYEADCLELLGTDNFRFLKRQLSQLIKALLQSQQEMRDGLRRVDPNDKTDLSADEYYVESQLQPDSAYCEAWAWISGVDRDNVFAANKRWKWKQRAQKLLKPRCKFLIRLEYTLWNGEAIKRRVATLVDVIEKLQKFTDLIDAHVPDLCMDKGKSPFSKRLACAVRLNKDWHRFSSVMSTISHGQFSVIPRRPDDEGQMNCFRSSDDITASVLVEERNERDDLSNRKVVYVAHSMSSSLPEDVLIDEIKRGNCRGKCPFIKRSHATVADCSKGH